MTIYLLFSSVFSKSGKWN